MNPPYSSQWRAHWPFDVTLSQEQYVRRLLGNYQTTPTVAGHVRRADRQIAAKLYHRGVPLTLVEAAFSLAAVRRIFRDPKEPPLHPIRSLHYFLPVLDELLLDPPDPDYVRYLDWKLADLAELP